MSGVLSLLALALLLLFVGDARALRSDEILPDPAQEQRARDIGRQLRCLVCQNQSIDDSDADLARDLRVLVRERIRAGDSDAQVLGFMQQRFGDFVLLRPPVRPDTYLLWFGPAVLVVLGAAGVLVYFRRRRRVAAVPPALTDDEARALESLLRDQRQ